MDNVDYFGEDVGGYRGYLTEQQLEWLANDLDTVGKLSAPSPLPWFLVGGVGVLVVLGLRALPDSGSRLVSFTRAHGPSPSTPSGSP